MNRHMKALLGDPQHSLQRHNTEKPTGVGPVSRILKATANYSKQHGSVAHQKYQDKTRKKKKRLKRREKVLESGG